VVRAGALAEPGSDDPKVQAIRRFHDAVAADPGLEATTIQTVGAKGHDGFMLALVTG
jgi:predicted O-methyltransferase YrrM